MSTISGARDIRLNDELSKKFNTQVEILGSVRGDTSAMELLLKIKLLHEIESFRLINFLRTKGTDRALEVLMAYIGYDTTTLGDRSPLSEAALLDLIDENLDEKVFYLLVHTESEEVEEIFRHRHNVEYDDLVKALVFHFETGAPFSKIVRQLSKHRRIFLSNLEKIAAAKKLVLPKEQWSDVDVQIRRINTHFEGICATFPEEFSEEFTNLISGDIPNDSVLRRISYLNRAFAAGEISEDDYLRIFRLRKTQPNDILKELKKARVS